jgi:hypothetical protein
MLQMICCGKLPGDVDSLIFEMGFHIWLAKTHDVWFRIIPQDRSQPPFGPDIVDFYIKVVANLVREDELADRYWPSMFLHRFIEPIEGMEEWFIKRFVFNKYHDQYYAYAMHVLPALHRDETMETFTTSGWDGMPQREWANTSMSLNSFELARTYTPRPVQSWYRGEMGFSRGEVLITFGDRTFQGEVCHERLDVSVQDVEEYFRG